eukprot:TRINITY_DN278_c0_g3_i3.p1 TRINITY_DN278_c0_g3~~TRINITY_DN278_c0_g3_i3.p1  ORF type:complete len:532 (+),score=113.82 TRINITY_DN278_c0_g3_i3:49-1644(+)
MSLLNTLRVASFGHRSIIGRAVHTSTAALNLLRRRTMPTETVYLPLSGGLMNHQLRNEESRRIMREVEALKEKGVLSPHAKIDPRDVFWVSDDLTFIGIGSRTNLPAFQTLLDYNIIRSRRVATVSDIFDRDPTRETLQDVFNMVTDDVACILETVQRPPRRRLVNEYVRSPTGQHILVGHDADLSAYLHDQGIRIVPVKQQDRLHNMTRQDVSTQQSTNHVLMVAPTAFEPNIQAQQDNYFMAKAGDGNTPMELTKENISRRALQEFACLHSAVTERAGVHVHLFTHEPHHDTPDAVFPNNWFSTHTDFEVGECTLVLYPMKVANRRKERRPEFIERLMSFRRYTHIYDMTRQEQALNAKFLEGTGSLVLDRINKVAYVAVSERSDAKLSQTWARVMGYDLVPFVSTDRDNRVVYHTNVVMCIGTRVAIICSESINDVKERDYVLARLREHHAVVEITRDQMHRFCGNVLELETFYGGQSLVMSSQAYNAFTPEQRDVMLQHVGDLIHADITAIETFGGGGVRCAIAELF